MTRPNEDPRPAPGEARPPLDYAPPTRGFAALEMTLGAFVTGSVILTVGFGAAIVTGMVGTILAPLFVAAVAGCVALALRRSPRTRAWAAGVWIGIGLSLLVHGICWIAVSGVRIGG